MAGRRFEELDAVPTRWGVISLRRRWDPQVEREVHEIKRDDEFLMSSLFTAGETALAELALAELPAGRPDPLAVVVGGLGLGYTAAAVLAEPAVGSLVVVEAVAPVIDWHRRGLIPAGATLATDPRCTLRCDDFFALAAGPSGPGGDGRRYDAVIVDIDHSPRQLLHPDHAGFYRPAGLRRLAGTLRPGGVFALWSDEPPDDRFTATLAGAFASARAEVVRFPGAVHPAANTVYLARTAVTARA